MVEYHRKIIFLVVLLTAVSWLYYSFVYNRAQVDLNIKTEKDCWFKIYWAGKGEAFSESNMAKVRISRKHESYNFSLTNIGRVDKLRIDTHEYAGKITLQSLVIKQKGYEPISLTTEKDFKKLQRGPQISKKWIENDTLIVISSGEDPNFLLYPEIIPSQRNYFEECVRVAALLFFTLLCYYSMRFLAVDYRFVPACLIVVLTLVTVMAFISHNNAHPDEYVHVAAVEYYKSHWLPPKILSDEIRNTYSPYGVSRLNKDEVYYFLAGKFAWITDNYFLDKYKNTRLFGVFLLFCMLMYCLKSVSGRLVALPFLVTPQVWYLFSYTNSDAFALVATYAAGCQIVKRKSILNSYLFQKDHVSPIVYGLFPGILLGVLLLLKHNYLAFVLFAFFCCICFFFFNIEAEYRKTYIIRLGVVCLIGIALFGSKRAVDFMVNGFEREALLKKAQIECSDHLHEEGSGTESYDQIFTLHMKEKGVTLEEMVKTYLWPEKVFKSAFGVYGYFNIDGHSLYYKNVKYSVMVLISYVFINVLFRGAIEVKILSVSAFLLIGLLTFASLYHSWVGDFQPQGRYLFPAIGMAGIIIGLARNQISERWVGLFTTWLFLLSAHSFIFVGLQHIPR